MRFSNWLIGLALAAMVAAAWFIFNPTVDVDPFQGDLRGVSYSAWRQDSGTLEKREPTIDEIHQDLQLIAGQSRSVRTYESTGISERIPAIAAEIGLNVTAGAWIDDDNQMNEEEIANLIKIAHNVGSVNQLIVGNEYIHCNRNKEKEAKDKSTWSTFGRSPGAAVWTRT